MKQFTVIFVALAALFFACRKNMDETTEREKGPIPSLNVESTLIGRVVDANGNPIANANVSVAGLSLTSNAEGVFLVKKQLLDNNGTLVRVVKTGFFEAARFAFPHLNGTTQLEIHLLPKNLSASFDAASGATIALGQGATATIPANAVVTASGTPYQGSVRAYGVWLDPTKSETFQTMPGDLRAIDTDGFAKLLKTYGMIGVELEGASGEKLNLAIDKTAKISLPVPASMRGTAPASIPLWHFNTANGYWEEEGAATLVNGSYEGEVSHFSFWNCDVPANYIKLKMCFNDANGTPIGGLTVQLTAPNFGSRSGYTDNFGLVSGLVPADETFVLEVSDPCGNVVHNSNIGPFNADTELGKITVPDTSTIVVSGKLQNCNHTPVSGGMVTLQQGNLRPIYAIANATGDFSFSLSSCSSVSQVVLTGYNYDDATQSAPQTITLTGTTINVGIVPVCTALDEYVIVNYNGHSKTFMRDPSFTVDGTLGHLNIAGPFHPVAPDSAYLFLGYVNVQNNQTTATLNNLFYSTVENNEFKTYGCNYCIGTPCDCQPADATPITFTSYPNAVGEYAMGSVSGSVRSHPDNLLVPFTLNFRLKRTK